MPARSRSTRWAATAPRPRSSPARCGPTTSSASRSCWSAGPTSSATSAGLEVIAASEVIAMDADPTQSVRRLKDSSLVRAAEAVRDGKASAMVSAGNTGATMGSALLRMGRIKGVARPAIATPIPCPGADTPTVMLDAGANAECQPGLAGAVRPDGRGLRPRALRHRHAEGRAAVDRRGARQGRHACARRPSPCSPSAGLGRRRRRLRRQRRGPRPHVARRRRGGHRRVHRQRRPQDPRGRHAGPGRRAGHARSAPTTPAGPPPTP